MAQLAKRLLLTLEVRGSYLIISQIFYVSVSGASSPFRWSRTPASTVEREACTTTTTAKEAPHCWAEAKKVFDRIFFLQSALKSSLWWRGEFIFRIYLRIKIKLVFFLQRPSTHSKTISHQHFSIIWSSTCGSAVTKKKLLLYLTLSHRGKHQLCLGLIKRIFK